MPELHGETGRRSPSPVARDPDHGRTGAGPQAGRSWWTGAGPQRRAEVAGQRRSSMVGRRWWERAGPGSKLGRGGRPAPKLHPGRMQMRRQGQVCCDASGAMREEQIRMR